MFAFLDQVRPTTRRVLALAIVAIVVSLLLSNCVLFHGRVGELLSRLKSEDVRGWPDGSDSDESLKRQRRKRSEFPSLESRASITPRVVGSPGS
jgi:hypothetical protein